MNPYTLPDGDNVQISFSGGRTSAYMLWHLLDANGGLPERAKVTFSNTGREMPETIRFVHECQSRWDVPIHWIEYDIRNEKHWYAVTSHNHCSMDGEPFEALIRKRGMLPNVLARFCTAELKLRPMQKFLVHEFGWDKWHSAIGIRADEARRARPSSEARTTAWYPLVDAGVTKAEITAFWAKQPFDLNLPNINGRTPWGNCDGCFLKSEHTQAALAREHPERHAWWERMETLASSLTSGSGGTFRPGYSKRDLRNLVERQGDWIFDMDGVLCQSHDGECTIV